MVVRGRRAQYEQYGPGEQRAASGVRRRRSRALPGGSRRRPGARVGAGNPDRGERCGLVERDLAGLAQLEQGEERDRLVDARQLAHLGVEVEAAPAAQHRTEPLQELGDGREAQRHVRERELRRRLGERAQRGREALRILWRELPLRFRRERRRADAEVAVALGREPLREPAGRLLHPSVLGQAPCKLLRGLLGLELGQLRLLVGEERAGLQLEQRRDQDEELAAGLQVELLAFGQPLDEGHDDRGDVDLGRLELLLQHERQQQVERALERVEV
jgi:hypothetical protein